jgi:hypothetical protein
MGGKSVVFLLVGLAAIIRLCLISTSHFVGDEALFYHTISQIREGVLFPELGPAVTGGGAKHPGPLFFYLMSLSQFISRTPEAANAEVAILGALSIGFFWSAMKTVLGAFPAFVASLMMACAPWSILYADRIWNSNVIIFFVSIAFWAATQIHRKADSRWIALFVTTCAVMPQIHLSVPIAWLGLMAMILPQWRKWNWRWIAVGVVVSVLFYAPYLDFELRTGFSNLKALLSENSHLPGARYSYEILFYAFRFFTLDVSYFELNGSWGGLSEWVSLKTAFTGSLARPFNVFCFLAFVSSLFLSGLIYAKAFQYRKYLGIFWWAFVVGVGADIVLLTVTPKPFFPHYLVTILPFFFALIGGLAHWMESRPKHYRAVWGLILVFCVGGVQASIAVSRNLDGKNGLRVQRQVIEIIDADRVRENWPPGTTVGLRLNYTGFLSGYQVLLEDIYQTPWGINWDPKAVVRGGPEPAYVLVENVHLRGGNPVNMHALDLDGLTLYRVH